MTIPTNMCRKCGKRIDSNKDYCDYHVCNKELCNNPKDTFSKYCEKHRNNIIKSKEYFEK